LGSKVLGVLNWIFGFYSLGLVSSRRTTVFHEKHSHVNTLLLPLGRPDILEINEYNGNLKRKT